ncbi:MAG: Gfo/Idh/MocA family protein [Thermoguttaceae bacterium]
MTSRRRFLKTAAAASAATTVVPYWMSSEQPVRAQAVSDRLQIGCIGVGDMGRGDARDFTNLGDVRVVCDVDSEYGVANAQNDENIGVKRDGKKVGKPDGEKDYRKVLERKDIDTVSIVTTDPWHVKIAMEALQAGKNVFCQKPLTLTIEEGQMIRKAVAKYPKLVFQVGTQQRSQHDQFCLAALMVRKGLLGDIKKMTCDIGGAPTGGPFEKANPPECLDWDFWLGQCPKTDYMEKRVRYEFRWWYEYSGGKFTDWGAHHIDFAHWALGETKPGCSPTTITPVKIEHPVPFKDGYPTVDNCYNTSHKFEISCKFPSGVEMVVTSDSKDGNGIFIEGTKGRMHVDRGRIKGLPIEEKWHEKITDADFDALYNGVKFDGWHKRNFETCIKNGGTPVSDPISHVQAMQSCHLCAIAARLGRELKWDPKAEKFIGDDQAQTFVSRTPRKGYEHPVV